MVLFLLHLGIIDSLTASREIIHTFESGCSLAPALAGVELVHLLPRVSIDWLHAGPRSSTPAGHLRSTVVFEHYSHIFHYSPRPRLTFASHHLQSATYTESGNPLTQRMMSSGSVLLRRGGLMGNDPTKDSTTHPERNRYTWLAHCT